MRLRHQIVLLGALITAPFLLALPLGLRDVQQAFDAELDARMHGASRAAQAALADGAQQVERAVRDLSIDPAVEDVARALHQPEFEGGELVPLGERLMALAGLDVLELLDDEGRILSSGHLPARAGDPNPSALELARRRPGRAVPMRVELRNATGIAPGLALVAVRPVDYGASRVYVLGGRLLGPDWAQRLSELTGAAISVHDGPLELARTGTVESPREAEVPVLDGETVRGTVRLELSAARLEATRNRMLRNAVLLWMGLLGVSTVLGVLLASRITRPIDALARAARTLARGELGREVETRASGEVGELVTAFNAMSRDLKTATERAAVAERIAAWREVARRLAHEIKNPLTPIKMSIETLVAVHRAGRRDFDEIFAESTGAVLEEVERLRRIIDEFSRFARLPEPRLEPIDLAELCSTVLSLYSSPPEGIVLARELSEGVQVEADRDQLTQVLINLLTNAEQAMKSGGRITVRAFILDEGEAALEVEDEGPGIPADQKSQLFEPYFTTREGGTGLGLAIAQRIAQEHGGRLEELGREGVGARFRLVLPRRALADQQAS